jgi:hypothetical protein
MPVKAGIHFFPGAPAYAVTTKCTAAALAFHDLVVGEVF